MKTAGITLATMLLAAAPGIASARDTSGFYIGGGAIGTSTSDCSDCDSSGYGLDAGYDFNSIVAIDFKYAGTEMENYTDTFGIAYLGANVGHDFNTQWFKLYGKAGFARITQEWAGYYSTYSYTETNPAIGVGVRFTPVREQKGFYIKAEGVSIEFAGSSVVSAYIGVGGKF